jgi:hypothetical protein
MSSGFEYPPSFFEQSGPFGFGDGQFEERESNKIEMIRGKGKGIEEISFDEFYTRNLGIL